MTLFPILPQKSIADRRYETRVACQYPLSKSNCARRWEVSKGHVDHLQVGGFVQFVTSAKRCYCKWAESESFMPGGAEEWMSVRETASTLKMSSRQLERMRESGVGPEWKKFGKKLLRYRRAGVAAYNQAASQSEKNG